MAFEHEINDSFRTEIVSRQFSEDCLEPCYGFDGQENRRKAQQKSPKQTRMGILSNSDYRNEAEVSRRTWY